MTCDHIAVDDMQVPAMQKPHGAQELPALVLDRGGLA